MEKITVGWSSLQLLGKTFCDLKMFNLFCSDFKIEEAKWDGMSLSLLTLDILDRTVGDISEIDQIIST